jgi:hypothetical protein
VSSSNPIATATAACDYDCTNKPMAQLNSDSCFLLECGWVPTGNTILFSMDVSTLDECLELCVGSNCTLATFNDGQCTVSNSLFWNFGNTPGRVAVALNGGCPSDQPVTPLDQLCPVTNGLPSTVYQTTSVLSTLTTTIVIANGPTLTITTVVPVTMTVLSTIDVTDMVTSTSVTTVTQLFTITNALTTQILTVVIDCAVSGTVTSCATPTSLFPSTCEF